MRTGLLGGTFDPPHTGHLILAEHARVELELDRVLFVPNSISPFKTTRHISDADIRAEMVQLAVSDNPHFSTELFEISRQGVSYTVDTLRHLTAKHPADEFILLMGADTFTDFPHWKDPDVVVSLAQLAVGVRPGSTHDFSSHQYKNNAIFLHTPLIDISSSSIRRRVREGKSIQYLVPWAVKIFIESTGLYRE
ncbi:MAG: nicotinate-nucleotide adenylyltransferase [Chlorobi bacterium]|nr:nicotinate-nucleotide adenylyltransferase [Chlorobiota bacterium]